jgi:hypothetical protein
MTYFERTLLTFLRNSNIEMEISGFDMESFEDALSQEQKLRLEMIESILYVDDDLMPTNEKIESIKELYRDDFDYID